MQTRILVIGDRTGPPPVGESPPLQLAGECMTLRRALALAARPADRGLLVELFLRLLVPDPDAVQCWRHLFDGLESLGREADRRTQTLLGAIDTRAWRAAIAERDVGASLADAVRDARAGALYAHIEFALRQIPPAMRPADARWAPWRLMLARLGGDTDLAPLDVEAPRGLLLVSAHTSLVHKVHPAARAAHPDTMIVHGGQTGEAAQRNALPVMMVRTLRGGGTVHVSPDGAQGTAKVVRDLWGLQLRIGTGFSWVAWRSGCTTMWVVPVMRDLDGTGLDLEVASFPPAEAGEAAEDYRERMADCYRDLIADGMARRPLDYGVPLLHVPPRTGLLAPARAPWPPVGAAATRTGRTRVGRTARAWLDRLRRRG